MIVLRGLVGLLKGLIVLRPVYAGLHLIGLLFLFVWGILLVVTAHPFHTVPITGVIRDVNVIDKGDAYDRTDFWLENDQRTFKADVPRLQPPLPRSHPGSGDLVTIWVSPDIDWLDLERTEALAMSVAPESSAAPAHVSWMFAHQDGTATRQRLVGLLFLGVVALVLALGTLWDLLTNRTSRNGRPPTIGVRRVAGPGTTRIR